MRNAIVSASVVLSLVSADAFAAPQQYDLNLYSTGINVVGNVDQSWTYSTLDADARLSSLTGQAVLATEGRWPMTGVWLDNDGVSKWVTPDANINQGSGSAGFLENSIWDYTTTFTLDVGTSLDSVVINGRWMSDNDGISITLNGNDLGFGATSGENISFTSWSNFNIGTAYGNNYFQDGLNTLTFTVRNAVGAGPSGLRVEMSGVATTVPEPETWAMLLAGLGLISGVARRRQARR